MDVIIANLHISVHRAVDAKRPELTLSRVEQEVHRARQNERLDRERQQALDQYAMHGGR